MLALSTLLYFWGEARFFLILQYFLQILDANRAQGMVRSF